MNAHIDFCQNAALVYPTHNSKDTDTNCQGVQLFDLLEGESFILLNRRTHSDEITDISGQQRNQCDWFGMVQLRRNWHDYQTTSPLYNTIRRSLSSAPFLAVEHLHTISNHKPDHFVPAL